MSQIEPVGAGVSADPFDPGLTGGAGASKLEAGADIAGNGQVFLTGPVPIDVGKINLIRFVIRQGYPGPER
jgi:hypothetical protein